MAGIKIVDLPAVGRDLAATDLFEMSLVGGTGSRKITGQEIMNASKLSVNNTPVINGTSGRIFFQDAANVLQQSGNLFWDNANGRLGIGTSSPDSKLHMFDSLRIGRTGFSSASSSFLITKGHNTSISQSGGDHIDISSSLYIRNGGNVLIGTSVDAGYKLDVNGNVRVNNLFAEGNVVLDTSNVWLSNGFAIGEYSLGNNRIEFYTTKLSLITNGNDVMTLFNSGNVAIGTTTDNGFKLDVNGTARVVTSIEVNGKRLSGGASALTSNTAYGANTLTVASANGDNTAIGYIALQNNTGVANTSVGSYSLTQNSTGQLNTAIGVYAGSSVTSGSNNILIGYNSQLGSGGQSNQIVIGVNASGIGSNTTVIGNSSITHGRWWGNLLIGTSTNAGYLLDVNGTTIVRGVLTIGDNVQGKISADSQYLNLYHNGGSLSILSLGFGSSIGASGYLRINQNAGDSAGTASGTIHRYDFNSGITNSSGTAQWNYQSLRPSYNFTGTYSGIVRGFYYNPTLTSMTGVTHYAIHSTSGRVRLEGLPTSPTGLSAGDLYNDGGTIKIV